MAQPVPTGKGLGSHHTQSNPPGGNSRVLQPTETCLSTYFSYLSSSPLFPAQSEAELLDTEPSQCQQTRDSHRGGIWQCPGPGRGNLAPSQDVCMGVLGQKLMTGKQRNTDPFSIQHQCLLPGLPTLWVPSHSWMGQQCRSKSVLLSLCIPDSFCLAPWWELKSRGVDLDFQSILPMAGPLLQGQGTADSALSTCPQTVTLQ